MNDGILGLDVGSVRIGVAVCAEPRLPAVPLTTIERRNLESDLTSVLALAEERSVRTIVVGYPIRLDGSRGPAAQKTDVFIEHLRRRFCGTVVTVDERLTTAAAAKKLRELDVPGSKRRRRLDEVAAVEILNSYLAAQARS